MWTKEMAGKYVTDGAGPDVLTRYDFPLPQATSLATCSRTGSQSSGGLPESPERRPKRGSSASESSESTGDAATGAEMDLPQAPSTPTGPPPRMKVLDSVVAQQMNMEAEQNLLSPVSTKYKRDKVGSRAGCCFSSLFLTPLPPRTPRKWH